MKPDYKPHNPKAPYSGKPPYYHTTPASWWADVDYPNPPQKQETRHKPKRRQPKRKAVVRMRKMRKDEKNLLWLLGLLLLAKWVIFGF